MKTGKLTGAKKNENRVELTFEEAVITIEVITENIVRVLNPCWKADYASIAIEKNVSIGTEFSFAEEKDKICIETSDLKLEVGDDFAFSFYDKSGKCLLSSYSGKRVIKETISEKTKKLLEAEGHKAAGGSKDYAVQVLFNRCGDEFFYGMGDKTGFLNKGGYAYENWNSDIPQLHNETMPALYKSIPFVMVKKTEGQPYGLFFDNTFHSYMDFGKENSSYFYYGADNGNLDFYFMTGDHLKDIVGKYTYLTGRAPMPQLWTLGYHQCRWGYENAEDIRKVAHLMRENHIPCESVQYDIDYMDGFRVFTWDEENYGPKGQLINELKQDGFKAVCIIDPGVKKDEGYFMYDEGIRNDYFAKDKDSEVYVNEVWPGDAVYPDFGREEVRKWWGDSHKILTDMGVQGIWNDMNEPASFRGPLPLDVQFHIGDRLTDHSEVHNVYGHFMSMGTYEGMKKITGKRPLVITRACYAGSQKYAAVWTGDNQSVWSHLRMLIPQLCNLGMSGFTIAGTDIGGFGGDSNAELMVRWVQAATFSTFFRNHCAKGQIMQEPWEFGEKVVRIYRKYVELHYRFLPYIYDLLHESQENGLPVMRPLVLNYDDDANTYELNDEYMVGENILVAPVVDQGVTKRMVYLPKGTWVDYWTKERYQGESYIIADAPIDTLPMYIKENSIIPMYENVQYVGEKAYDKLELLVAGKEAHYTHYQDNGEDFKYMDGEYNLYTFDWENGELKTNLVHEGYEKYKTVEVNVI
ncbi:glycoside hydrolase family 31 protein [Butyrivibrio sp. AC2005]|uniref:glycoside hydrolase family 31 protein n=1 Tax=Butyrivibrio sp. AC2005 TaxID=1280672 RepID=UPI0003FA0623|nr:glycoside hydrolase family 31 protein [Butyrivibrio sp. AC2005]